MELEAIKRACGRITRGPKAGTGFLIAPRLMVTADHVLERSGEILVQMETSDPSAQPIEAEIVLRDPANDLAVIKLRLDPQRAPLLLARAIPEADTGKEGAAPTVIAMGYPTAAEPAGDPLGQLLGEPRPLGTLLTLGGELEDPRSRDDKSRPACRLRLPAVTAGQPEGMSGGPVLCGDFVVGVLRRFLPLDKSDSARPQMGVVYAASAAVVRARCTPRVEFDDGHRGYLVTPDLVATAFRADRVGALVDLRLSGGALDQGDFTANVRATVVESNRTADVTLLRLPASDPRPVYVMARAEAKPSEVWIQTDERAADGVCVAPDAITPLKHGTLTGLSEQMSVGTPAAGTPITFHGELIGHVGGGSTARLCNSAKLREWLNVNPLLSELSFLRLRGSARWPFPPVVSFTAVSVLWALAAVWMSHRAGANCMNLRVDGRHALAFGYIHELGSGPFAVIGLVLFNLAMFLFLGSAGRALEAMQHDRLRIASPSVPDESPLRALALANRRTFRWLTPVLAIAAVCLAVIPEVVGYDDVAFGWVQAPRIAEEFSTPRSYAQIHAQYGSIRALDNACGQQRETCIVTLHEGPLPDRASSHVVFLVLAIGAVCVWVGLSFWVLAKMVFLLLTLLRALRRAQAEAPPAGRLLLRLQFDDPRHRFGLADLDGVYQSVLTICIITVTWFVLQAAGNRPKGTAFAPDGAVLDGAIQWHLIAQPISWVVTAVVLTVVFGGPVVGRAVTKHMAHRYVLGREAVRSHRSEGNRVDLDRQIALAKRQTTYPRNELWFYVFAFITTIGLLAVPLLDLDISLLPGLNVQGRTSSGQWLCRTFFHR